MAKPKAQRPPDAKPSKAARPSGLHNVRLDLTQETHDWLRVLAANNRLSMSGMARWLVEDAKERGEKGPGKKT